MEKAVQTASKRNLVKLSMGHAVTDINQGALPIMLAYLTPVHGNLDTGWQ